MKKIGYTVCYMECKHMSKALWHDARHNKHYVPHDGEMVEVIRTRSVEAGELGFDSIAVDTLNRLMNEDLKIRREVGA